MITLGITITIIGLVILFSVIKGDIADEKLLNISTDELYNVLFDNKGKQIIFVVIGNEVYYPVSQIIDIFKEDNNIINNENLNKFLIKYGYNLKVRVQNGDIEEKIFINNLDIYKLLKAFQTEKSKLILNVINKDFSKERNLDVDQYCVYSAYYETAFSFFYNYIIVNSRLNS